MEVKKEDIETWDKVRAILKDKGWSYAELGRRLGVDNRNSSTKAINIMNRCVFTTNFLNIVDILGYEVEVKFEKKKKKRSSD